MQETNEFQGYKDRSVDYSFEELTQTEPAVTDPFYIEIIRKALDTLRSYYSEDKFRATLTPQRKRTIESNINGIYSQFDEIRRLRRESPDQLQPSLEGIINNIQNYLEEIDLRFANPFQTFLLADKKNVTSIVSSIEAVADEVKKTNTQIRDTLDKTNLLVGGAAGAQLYSHFLLLANGKSVRDNDDSQSKNTDLANILVVYSVLAVVVPVLVFSNAKSISNYFRNSGTDHATTNIKIISIVMLLLITGGAIMHIWLKRTRPSGYERAAAVWGILAVLTVLFTAVWGALLLRDLGSNPGWDQLVPKVITLLAPAYFIRLCVQNYRANKHLAVSNIHRATIARIVGAFAKNLERSEPELQVASLNAQAAIYQKAAELIFDPGETGFISRREGAGASDNYFDGLSKIDIP